jgi:hypothetical protein
MTVKTIYKNRHCDRDRRKFFSKNNGTERRSGVDRRKLDEKLKDMIEHNIKDRNKEKQTPKQPSYGNIIRRRKGKKDKRIFE